MHKIVITNAKHMQNICQKYAKNAKNRLNMQKYAKNKQKA